MARFHHLGKEAERQARLYLQQKGHLLLETNYRFDHKEIDIISLAGEVLVFTEIKARSSYGFGYPEEAVGMQKQAFMKQAAEWYCSCHPQYTMIRFDVISILMEKGSITELLHFEDAFY